MADILSQEEIDALLDVPDEIVLKRTDLLSLTDENFKILRYVEKSFGESPSFILQLDGVEYISNGKNIFIENTKENQEKIIEEYDVKEELERLLNAPLLQDNATVLDMSYMFAGCKFIVSVELDTANVINMSGMFSWCSSLERVELDTANVTNMQEMFFLCSSLERVELDTANVTDMSWMFYECSSLERVELDTANVTNMLSMFFSCSSLKTVELDTANVTDMSWMFFSCSSLERVELDTANVTNMLEMFSGCNLDVLLFGKLEK